MSHPTGNSLRDESLPLPCQEPPLVSAMLWVGSFPGQTLAPGFASLQLPVAGRGSLTRWKT